MRMSTRSGSCVVCTSKRPTATRLFATPTAPVHARSAKAIDAAHAGGSGACGSDRCPFGATRAPERSPKRCTRWSETEREMPRRPAGFREPPRLTAVPGFVIGTATRVRLRPTRGPAAARSRTSRSRRIAFSEAVTTFDDAAVQRGERAARSVSGSVRRALRPASLGLIPFTGHENRSDVRFWNIRHVRCRH